jgi:hypothetical protein
VMVSEFVGQLMSGGAADAGATVLTKRAAPANPDAANTPSLRNTNFLSRSSNKSMSRDRPPTFSSFRVAPVPYAVGVACAMAWMAHVNLSLCP